MVKYHNRGNSLFHTTTIFYCFSLVNLKSTFLITLPIVMVKIPCRAREHDYGLITCRAIIKCPHLRSFSNKCENHFSDRSNASKILDQLDFAKIRTNVVWNTQALYSLQELWTDETCAKVNKFMSPVTSLLVLPRWNDDVFPFPGTREILYGLAAKRQRWRRQDFLLVQDLRFVYRSFCCLRIFLNAYNQLIMPVINC